MTATAGPEGQRGTAAPDAEEVSYLTDVAAEVADEELIRSPSGRLVPDVPLDRALGALTRPHRRPRNAEPAPRWVGVLLGVLAVLFVPYIVQLALELPDRAQAVHYAAAWVGLDVMELLALAATAWFAWTRSTWVAMAATSAATLIVCDAWFDTVTARGDRFVAALGEALLVELPMAAFCLWIARHAEVVADRATRQLLRRSARQAERIQDLTER